MDVLTTSGFAEFLDDGQLAHFYRLCHDALRPGGLLISSATVRNRFSDFLMRELAELHTHYRDETALAEIFARTPFRDPQFQRDPAGYQVLIRASKC